MIRTVIAIKDMSAGNSETGEAWQETKIFSRDQPIEDILAWAMSDCDYRMNMYTRKRITITVPHQEE
jgi:hypothetical protein